MVMKGRCWMCDYAERLFRLSLAVHKIFADARIHLLSKLGTDRQQILLADRCSLGY